MILTKYADVYFKYLLTVIFMQKKQPKKQVQKTNTKKTRVQKITRKNNIKNSIRKNKGAENKYKK
jgi:hypothetical protein